MKELTYAQTVERSLMKRFRKDIWSKFIVALKRYQLVEEGEKTTCSQCSLHDFCVPYPNCFCYIPGYENKNTRYVLENGNTD